MTALLIALKVLSALAAGIVIWWWADYTENVDGRRWTYHGHAWCEDCRRSVALSVHGECSECGSQSIVIVR